MAAGARGAAEDAAAAALLENTACGRRALALSRPRAWRRAVAGRRRRMRRCSRPSGASWSCSDGSGTRSSPASPSASVTPPGPRAPVRSGSAGG